MHKDFPDITNFKLIIDNTRTRHCLVEECLRNLLKSLTIIEFSKDFSDANRRIKAIT